MIADTTIRLWSHRHLNSATHTQLHRFLGGTSMKSLAHLVDMGKAGTALNNSKQSLVTDANLDNFKGIPVYLFSGSENAVYKPENTDVSFSKLRVRLGADDYKREEIPGMGHLDCWMSEKAVKNVFPKVLWHVDQVCGGSPSADVSPLPVDGDTGRATKRRTFSQENEVDTISEGSSASSA